VAFYVKVRKGIAREKKAKSPFSTIPLSFDAPLQRISANIRIDLISLETRRIPGLQFAAGSMAVSSLDFFVMAPKYMCVM